MIFLNHELFHLHFCIQDILCIIKVPSILQVHSINNQHNKILILGMLLRKCTKQSTQKRKLAQTGEITKK